MAMTATQKIIAAHCGKQSVSPGEVVMVNVDKAMGNDITAPVAVRTVAAKGDKVDNPDNVIFVLDHFVPNKDIKSAEQCKCIREFAHRQGISHVYDVGQMGIEHALLPEKGLVRPSEIILGADSHTCTYGALGAFSTGVGSTDLAVAIMSGKGWLRVPEAIKINLTGKPGKYVSGKDLILTLIGITGVDGANYKSLEFFGDGIDALSMDDRFTVANMAIECGAKNAFFPVDGKAEEYLHSAGVADFTVTVPDADAEYVRTIDIDLSKLQPTVAFPHLPSNVHTFDEGFDIPIDQDVCYCIDSNYWKGSTIENFFEKRRRQLITTRQTENGKYLIRRLTPKETWRLMGCSDEDFEKAASLNSNTNLYRQAGNSIVVPVLEAVFEALFKSGKDDCRKTARGYQYSLL